MKKPHIPGPDMEAVTNHKKSRSSTDRLFLFQNMKR